MNNKNSKYLSILCAILMISACESSEKTVDTIPSNLSLEEKPVMEETSTITQSVIEKPLVWLQGSWRGDLYYGQKNGDLEVNMKYYDDKHVEIFYPKEKCHSLAQLDRKKLVLKELSMQGDCPKHNSIQLKPINAEEEYIDDGFEDLSAITFIHMQYEKLNPKDDLILGILEKE